MAVALTKTGNEYRFYTSEKVRKAFPKEWDSRLIIKSISEAKKYKPDFVLSPGNFVDFRIPGIKVQLFHGLGVEKEAHFKIRHFFDVYLTSGPFVTERFNRLKKENKNYFEVLETGWVKMDYILNYNSNNLKEKYNIPQGKKVVLYAPTFSKKMESASKALSKMDSLVKDDEIWLLKFHELMDIDVINSFKAINNENLRIIEENDITPLLYISDIMISDTSSVIYEFMALDKPVITLNTMSRKDKGIDVDTPEEIRGAIDSLKANPLLLKERIKRNMSEVNPYLDGRICYNVIEKLAELKEKESFPRKSKPLNLFRKIQIMYHSNFRKGYLR